MPCGGLAGCRGGRLGRGGVVLGCLRGRRVRFVTSQLRGRRCLPSARNIRFGHMMTSPLTESAARFVKRTIGCVQPTCTA